MKQIRELLEKHIQDRAVYKEILDLITALALSHQDSGYDEGYSDGFTDGEASGYDKGYHDGRSDGEAA